MCVQCDVEHNNPHHTVVAFIVLMDADLQQYVWRDAVDQRAFSVIWVVAFIVLMDADLQQYVNATTHITLNTHWSTASLHTYGGMQ